MPTKIEQQTQQSNIIILSEKQEHELLSCLSYNRFTELEIKHKLIKYAKMFIGNKISSDLCKKLRSACNYDNSFKVKEILIKEKSYLIFYINDFVSLIEIEGISEERFFLGRYIYTTELNGYTLAYSFHEQFTIDTMTYPENDNEYISFILYKDDMVYIMNDYCYNKELNTSIYGTRHNEVKYTGIPDSKLRDCLNSLFILNTLRK